MSTPPEVSALARVLAEALRLGAASPTHVEDIRDAEARALDNQ